MAARDPAPTEELLGGQLVAGGGRRAGGGVTKKNNKQARKPKEWVGNRGIDRSQARRHRFSFPALPFGSASL